MSSFRFAVALAAVFATPCLGQQVTFRFNNDPQRIGDVLRESHVSGSLIFSGGCKFHDRTAPVPSVGMRRDLGSVRETFQRMLAVNSEIRVAQDPDGMIRMVEEGVPTDILDVRIHHISFDDSHRPGAEGRSLHGGFAALMVILAAPEVRAFKKAQIDPSVFRLEGIMWDPSGPDVTGELNDVTVSQALDYVLKTFPGYWVYEDASCEDGSRTVSFRFY